ncbi:MAG: ArnT family glycosyltransferase, partial [Flavobacteriales bacterium]
EFAARLPNAICGILTILVLFNIGNRLISKNFGLLWVLVYFGSFLPQTYFRTGIIDPWFNLFIFACIHQLILATRKQEIERIRIVFSAVLIGLAVLTKGPTAFALLGVCCAIYFVLSFKKHHWNFIDPLLYLTIVVAVGFSWFFIEIARGHGYVVQEFIDYHIRLLSQSEAGHGQPFYYHPIVLLLGCFPMSLFFIFSWFNKDKPGQKISHYQKWMTILFWVVLIVFSIVKTKIIHYSSLTYFPMSFLAAFFIYEAIKSKRKFSSALHFLILVYVLLFGTTFLLASAMEKIQVPLLQLLTNDSLAHGNFSQSIPDGSIDWLAGALLLIGGIGAVIFLVRGKQKLGVLSLFGTGIVAVSVMLFVLAPKIDKYTQSSLFSFYEKHAQTHYLQPLAMHSYAHLFYGKRNPLPVKTDDEPKWLLFEKVDKPVFFIVRAHDLGKTLGYFPHLKEVSKKGGYVILERTDPDYPFLGSP